MKGKIEWNKYWLTRPPLKTLTILPILSRRFQDKANNTKPAIFQNVVCRRGSFFQLWIGKDLSLVWQFFSTWFKMDFLSTLALEWVMWLGLQQKLEWWDAHSVEKRKIYSHLKKISWNYLIKNFDFTNFSRMNGENKFPQFSQWPKNK